MTNAGAEDITGEAATPYVWRTSFTNAQIAAAMGEHLAAGGLGPVYVIAPDYAAGKEVIAGFNEAFEAGGGRSPARRRPPFGTTQDYQPFLSPIQASGAKATFCFFSGAEAIRFVKQYAAVRAQGHDPAVRLGLPHRGQRARRTGRRRARRADDAALLRPDRQRRQQGVRGGVPGRLRRAADLLRHADLRRRERPGRALRARRGLTATSCPRRSAASARSTTARAARGPSRARPPAEHLPARGDREGGTLVNTVVRTSACSNSR